MEALPLFPVSSGGKSAVPSAGRAEGGPVPVLSPPCLRAEGTAMPLGRGAQPVN